MILCRVTGSVVATHKNLHLENNRLLLIRPVDLDGEYIGNHLVALDRVDAGQGDLVLVVKEGGSARIAFNNDKIPVQAFVVAVVDELEVRKDVLEEDWPVVSMGDRN